MKKTLLVAALATGFAGVAHAESSVTLYGLVDAGVGYSETKTTKGNIVSKDRQIGAVSNVKNGSRWGLKGTEDLGNGTAAIFQLEGGFDPANGNLGQSKAGEIGKVFGRKAIIGLTGESWGTFTIGRQYNAADDIVSGIDPFGTAWGNAAATSTFGDSLSARQDATLKYVSPSFDGFKFVVSTGYSNTKESTNGTTTGKLRSTVASAAIGYANGPVELGVSYDYDRQRGYGVIDNAAVSGNRLAKAWTIAGAYDFDVAKLHLGYGQQRDGVVNGNFGLAKDLNSYVTPTGGVADSQGLRTQAWFAGVSAPLGESAKVIASYQGGKIKHKLVDGVRINTHIWSLGYQQNLSKRTHVYVLGSYGQSKVKNNGTVAKAKTTQAVVGLQHRF